MHLMSDLFIALWVDQFCDMTTSKMKKVQFTIQQLKIETWLFLIMNNIRMIHCNLSYALVNLTFKWEIHNSC